MLQEIAEIKAENERHAKQIEREFEEAHKQVMLCTCINLVYKLMTACFAQVVSRVHMELHASFT